MKWSVSALTTAVFVIVGANTIQAYEQPTGQAFYSGNEMLAYCHRQNDDGAMFYAVAIAEMTANLPHSPACLPKDVTEMQARDIFCKYLEDHPEKRHLGALTLGLQSFSAAFPC